MCNQIFKQLLSVTFLAMFCIGAAVSAPVERVAKHVTLQITTDLYQDAQLARQKGVPLVVMFSQQGCVYCNLVRENFLKPMLISGDYDNKALLREVKIDNSDIIRNFDGKVIPGDELATVYRAYLTPTVIVFDSYGKAHHRIVGLTNEYYYGGELDDAIDKAYNDIHRVAVNN